tara:strand:+ start:1230 stop:1754 length:525 start_codon:yes stop_codon:yes gene_type:complete
MSSYISCKDILTRETKHVKVDDSVYVYIRQLEHSLEQLMGTEPMYALKEESPVDEEEYMFADRPDNWVVLEIMASVNDTKPPTYKVLAGWSGGYLDGDYWKLNSGIVEVRELDKSWVFIGHSGSEYVCGKEQYSLRMNNAGIYEEMITAFPHTIRMMPEDTDWSTLIREENDKL